MIRSRAKGDKPRVLKASPERSNKLRLRRWRRRSEVVAKGTFNVLYSKNPPAAGRPFKASDLTGGREGGRLQAHCCIPAASIKRWLCLLPSPSMLKILAERTIVRATQLRNDFQLVRIYAASSQFSEKVCRLYGIFLVLKPDKRTTTVE